MLFSWVIIILHAVLTIAHSSHDEPKYRCPAKSELIYPCSCQPELEDGINIRCENSNLATLSVALQNVATLNIPVVYLTIYKGHFERLYGPVFTNIRARHLTIEKTHIEQIGEHTFFGINQTLEYMSLLQSNLSNLLPHTFGNLGQLKELTIDGHMLRNLNKSLFVDQEISSRLEILRIINGPLTEIPIETFQPLRRLKILDLHGNNFEILQRNQFKNMREVESLDISFNKLKKLEGHHIADLTKLGWCNVSHNELSEISRGTFARNTVLKVLNLSHNNISRLDGNSFRGMRFLRRLYMSDNQIEKIGRGAFGTLTRIGTIDLARNNIKKIEFQMFAELRYIEVLDIAENRIKIIENQSFKNIYQAKINISHNIIDNIEPYSFENCVNITILDLSFNHITNFTKNVFDVTTFATELQLAHNMLTDLGQVPLQNMTGLKVLNVSFNRVQIIPKNCFPKLYELHTIDVSHNNISSISNGVFQTLFSLRFLNLSHNSLEEIKSSVFGTLPTLLGIDLSHNNLSYISRGALAKLTSMRSISLHNNNLEKLFQIPISLNELHLQKNSINSIPTGTWPVMNSLLLLDLSDNKIGDSLEEGSFKGLLVLQKLLLNNNGIMQPPVKSLAGMTTLQYLHLERNNITALERSAFGKLPVLFELNLSSNGITCVSKRAFDGLLQLLTLNLSKNNISNIPNDAFIGLPSLRNLDLSFNFLSKLDNKTNSVLDDLLSLDKLNLSYNKISFITRKTFPSNQYIPYNLKVLDLSHNQIPVLTYDITFGTRKLRALDLSYNHINEIRRGVLANLSSLENLDLSNNELTNLMTDEHIFDLPKNLTKIILNNNKIYRIPFEVFLKEPKLKVIDLRNNSLEVFPLSLLWNIQNGTTVLFSDNPLICNCGTRPLKHYMLTKADVDYNLEHITCSLPTSVYSEKLMYVEDEKLQCTGEENQQYTQEIYGALSDIHFRDVVLKENILTTRWYVSSHKDIADFTFYIRTKYNEIVFQKDYSYNTRYIKIPIDMFIGNISGDTEVCIVSRDSSGNIGKWFKTQCRKLSTASNKYNRLLSINNSGSILSWLNGIYVFYLFIIVSI